MSSSPGDAYTDLTAPDGPYPLTEAIVDGRCLTVFNRSPFTLAEAFLATRDFGDAEALVYREERYTYAQQWSLVMRLARQLRERYGLAKGDRVVVSMRNFPEWSFVLWAVELIGGVVVPLNAWLTGSELVTLIADSAPVVIIADQERIDRLAEFPEALAGARGVLQARGDLRPGVTDLAELLADGLNDSDIEPAEISPDETASILYTSGTTGKAKGVIGTHRNHVSTILVMRLRAQAIRQRRAAAGISELATPIGTTLVTNPIFHIAAFTALTSNIFAGRRVVLMYKWEAEEAMRLIEQEQVSELSGPPLVVRELVDVAAEGRHDTSSLVALVNGAALAPPQLIRDIGTVFEGRVSPGTGYGSTETTGVVVTITGQNYLERPTSVGQPLPTVEIRVRDESNGELVGRGGLGELEIRGPQVTPGYYRDPEATADSFRDGWYCTGDRVQLDDDGFVHLVGRLKDIVIRGGENVYCPEVESALEGHPEVVEAAVIGLPHPLLGEEVAAVVRLRPGGTADESELIAYVAGHLASFKVPATITFTENPLPRTATGKVVKADLKTAYGAAVS
jgi:long-chain acyl-CoA synthetase